MGLCGRVVDLLQVIRGNYYHPGFHGSFSLKSMVPALVPDLEYDDLDIPEGLAATAAYAGLVADKIADSDGQAIREALLAYCARDTEVMVRVFERLVTESHTRCSLTILAFPVEPRESDGCPCRESRITRL